MLVSEAAKKLGISTQTLRKGLQQRVFPFGEAVKTTEKRWTYHINDAAFKKYLDGGFHETVISNTNNFVGS